MSDEFLKLESTAKVCTRCRLSEGRTNVVFGSGNPQAKLLIIGEAPGADEDAQAKPFVGRSGQLLTKILMSEGINRDKDAYIANIIKCRPPENRKPKSDEVATCIPYLYQQIDLIKPEMILLLGATAVAGILKDPTPITKLRGQVFDVDFGGRVVETIPTFHPSYLLRNPVERDGSPIALFRQDIHFAKSKLGL